MSTNESLTIDALVTLLRESLFRAAAQECFILNPNDPGLIETLKGLSAEVASTPPGPGRKTVCAHANHVLYGIELANQAFAGNPDVYKTADWNIAWKVETVTDRKWSELIARIEQQANLLVDYVIMPREWDQIMLTGSHGIAAHTAYHLGAIRQILLDVQK